MSRENAALLQRFTGAPLSQMSETEIGSYFHADLEFLPLRAATEGAYHGIAGIERFIADNKTVFEKFEPRWEYLDLDDRVLAWGAIHVRARQSGIDTDIPVAAVVEFREGKIARWEVWASKEKASKHEHGDLLGSNDLPPANARSERLHIPSLGGAVEWVNSEHWASRYAATSSS